MNYWAPHSYRQLALEAGLSEEQTEEVIAHYEHAHKNRVAPVISLKHLGVSCGVEYRHLRSRCARRPFMIMNKQKFKPYKTFAIRKRSGGKRIISVPADDLLQVQKWIHHNILSKQSCHPRAFAYQTNRSVAACASVHLGCRWLIKLDLSHFFESITERQVYRVFAGLGYSPLVSFELARLCTRIDKCSSVRKHGAKWEANRNDKGVAIQEYSYPVVGYLPQGAPTSPMLSNLVALDLDEALYSLARDVNVEYTRYSDDFYFSSASPAFLKEDAIGLIRRTAVQVKRHGFDLNRSKTVIAGPGHRKVVLGILVDGHKLRLSKAFRRKLEWHYRHCLIDPTAHALHKNFDSILGLKNHVCGLLSYAKYIDPEYVARLESQPISWPFLNPQEDEVPL